MLLYHYVANITSASQQIMNQKNINILLLEDDDGDAKALQRALRKAKLDNAVHRAIDGVHALDILLGRNGQEKLNGPHLLLVDINMPRMDGIEFLTELRQIPGLNRTVAFMLTASAREEDTMAAYDLNVAGYIRKTEAELLKLVELLDCYQRVVRFPTLTSFSKNRMDTDS